MIKNALLLSLLLLLIAPVYALAQDKQFDSTKWTTLRSELLKRSNAVLRFQVYLMRSKGLDKKVWAELAKNAADLGRHLDTVKTVNSAAIKTTTKLNSNLTKTLGVTIMQLMLKDQKTLTESTGITDEMEAIEKQLVATKQEYNKACEESNRPDLVFDEKTPAGRPVGIGS